MTVRVSTQAQHLLFQSRMVESQRLLTEKHLQVVTKQKSQRYSGIALDSRRVVTLENEVAHTKQFIDNNTQIQLRLKAMTTAVTSVAEVARNVRSLLQSVPTDPNQATNDIQSLTKIWLNEVVDYLNVEMDGHYLFSGNKTDTIPVVMPDPLTTPATSPIAAVNPSTAPDYSYYKGDQGVLSTRIDDDSDLAYGLKADAKPFERIIWAIRSVAAIDLGAVTPTEARTVYDAAEKALDSALDPISRDSINSLQYSIASSVNTVKNTTENLKTYKAFTEITVAEIKHVDDATAAAEFSAIQQQLEASYTALARASQLSFVNYMK